MDANGDATVPGFGTADFVLNVAGNTVHIQKASVGFLHGGWNFGFFSDGSAELPTPPFKTNSKYTVCLLFSFLCSFFPSSYYLF